MSGGVVKSIEKKLGESLYIYDEPEIVGAMGAALIALENVEENS
jgi:activator of 2-hydroxyglutaryl-CoA dehydratase